MRHRKTKPVPARARRASGRRDAALARARGAETWSRARYRRRRRAGEDDATVRAREAPRAGRGHALGRWEGRGDAHGSPRRARLTPRGTARLVVFCRPNGSDARAPPPRNTRAPPGSARQFTRAAASMATREPYAGNQGCNSIVDPRVAARRAPEHGYRLVSLRLHRADKPKQRGLCLARSSDVRRCPHRGRATRRETTINENPGPSRLRPRRGGGAEEHVRDEVRARGGGGDHGEAVQRVQRGGDEAAEDLVRHVREEEVAARDRA